MTVFGVVRSRRSSFGKEARMKVDPFHTDNEEYPPTHRSLYHHESECQYGKEIKADGNEHPRNRWAAALRQMHRTRQLARAGR
jgi:hypothetical protein